MYATRLYRCQIELQSHRSWLKVFVESSKLSNFPKILPNANPYGTRYVNTAVRRPSRISINPKAKKTSSKSRTKPTGLPISSQPHRELHEAVKTYDIEKVAELYSDFPVKKELQTQDLSAIGQCIHYSVRLYNQKPHEQKRREEIEVIVTFTTQLINDIKGRKLVPAPQAYKHVLGALKEARVTEVAVQFWQWLEAQDNEYLSHDVYAAAIELLADHGTPLLVIEELYQTCLARLPGSFLAYHFSSDAIVPDREQEVTISQVPVLLLQAIATARLMHGDTRNAYLAFDTALRLCPARLPLRLFNLFIEERPASEGFTVLAIACRSGQTTGTGVLRNFLASIRQSSASASSESLPSHICLIRTMLATLYLHLAAGGVVKSNSVCELVIAITRILRLPGVEEITAEEREPISAQILQLVKKTFETFAHYGATPHISAFNSIIVNIGGYGHSKEVVRSATADLRAIGLEPTAATRRSLISAGGLLQDKELINESWASLVKAREKEAALPDDLDFVVLIKAATSCGHGNFAQEQFHAFQANMESSQRHRIQSMLNQPLIQPSQAAQNDKISLESLVTNLGKLDADLDTINEQIQRTSKVQNFGHFSPPAHLLANPSKLQIPETEMIKLYDEFSTEPSISTAELGEVLENSDNTASTAAVEKREPESSLTNLSFGTLRYENWKSINYLLSLAEKHDELYSRKVNAAINAGNRPPRRNKSLTAAEQNEMLHFGLSEVGSAENAKGGAASSHEGALERARSEILRLRGRAASGTSD